MGAEFTLIASIATIIGSGVSVYVGLRVSQAEGRKDILRLTEAIENMASQHERDYDRISRRLDRIEDPYFKPK